MSSHLHQLSVCLELFCSVLFVCPDLLLTFLLQPLTLYLHVCSNFTVQLAVSDQPIRNGLTVKGRVHLGPSHVYRLFFPTCILTRQAIQKSVANTEELDHLHIASVEILRKSKFIHF